MNEIERQIVRLSNETNSIIKKTASIKSDLSPLEVPTAEKLVQGIDSLQECLLLAKADTFSITNCGSESEISDAVAMLDDLSRELWTHQIRLLSQLSQAKSAQGSGGPSDDKSTVRIDTIKSGSRSHKSDKDTRDELFSRNKRSQRSSFKNDNIDSLAEKSLLDEANAIRERAVIQDVNSTLLRELERMDAVNSLLEHDKALLKQTHGGHLTFADDSADANQKAKAYKDKELRERNEVRMAVIAFASLCFYIVLRRLLWTFFGVSLPFL